MSPARDRSGIGSTSRWIERSSPVAIRAFLSIGCSGGIGERQGARLGRFGCRTAPSGARPLVLAVDEDAMDDVDAQEEDAQRPPRVGAADPQQRSDRPEAAAEDADEP